MSRSVGFSGPGRRAWRWTVLAAAGAIAISACSSASTTHSSASPSAQPVTSQAAPGQFCRQLVVPAYFYSSSIWTQAADSKPAPSNIILDISGVGAGNALDPHFQSVVAQAKAAGVTVLGYISTVDGQRPASEVEAEVRNYRAWYGVTDIFLDRVSGTAAQLGYYQQLADYIHHYDAGSSVWLNPGDYPDQDYMSVGDVVMVFEGTYTQYLNLQVPSWTYQYPASKFAHTIYATPSSSLTNVFKLATSRRGGHVYVTDGAGANPYGGLPSYWSYEDSVASAGCAR